MKTLDVCFKFILDDDDAYFSGSDKLIIREWIKNNYRIYGDLTISDDLVVDCAGHVSVKDKSITSLTNDLFRWGKVSGNFICADCKKLVSLEGAPESIGGGFICSDCENLKTLEGGPKEVEINFWCDHCNELKTLKGAPEWVGGNFYCGCCNKLVTLEGAPKKVGWDFEVINCDNLTSLEGAPKDVGRLFDCGNCSNLKIPDFDRGRYEINHMKI